MRVYLDTCSLQRPLDDKSQLRVHLEAEAVLAILLLCERKILTLLSSDILIFENDRNPHTQRRAFVSELLKQASETIALTQTITHRAKEFEQQSIKAIDALHLATAEEAQAVYFCTCDDRFLKKAKMIGNLRVAIAAPLDLIQEVTT